MQLSILNIIHTPRPVEWDKVPKGIKATPVSATTRQIQLKYDQTDFSIWKSLLKIYSSVMGIYRYATALPVTNEDMEFFRPRENYTTKRDHKPSRFYYLLDVYYWRSVKVQLK